MKLFWQRFKFLGIVILALIVFTPILVFSRDFWSFSPSSQQIFDLSSIGRGSVCMRNNSSNNYFVPTKTASEWDAFSSAALSRLNISIPSSCCGNGVCEDFTLTGSYPDLCFVNPATSGCETPTTCWADCAPKCDYQPSGIYLSVLYSTFTNCGATPNCVPQYPPAIQSGNVYGTSPSPLPSVSGSQENGGCGVLKIQRSSKCASLIKPQYSVCNGDPCVNAVYSYDFRNPTICVGTYDSLLNTCIYKNSITKSISWGESYYIDTYKSFNHSYPGHEYDFNTTPMGNNGAVASWGTCATVVPCGDGICSSGYGETCATCSSDCGACAYIDCYSNRDCSNNYCEGLSASCEGSYGCNNYYDEDSCSYASCYWSVSSPGYCPGF